MTYSPNIDEAIRIYYENVTIGSQEIMRIFECSRPTARKLKKQVGDGVRINTDVAYRAWGFSISDLEKRRSPSITTTVNPE